MVPEVQLDQYSMQQQYPWQGTLDVLFEICQFIYFVYPSPNLPMIESGQFSTTPELHRISNLTTAA